jgi:hypothetical protein
MTVVGFDAEHAGEADQAAVVGEDADDVGASSDLAVEALEGIGRSELAPVVSWERVEGQEVGLGVLEHRRDLAEPPFEMRDGFGEPITRLRGVVSVEDRADQRGQQPMLVAAGVAEAVSEEVDGAALPTAAEDLRDRCLEASVGV